MTDPERCRSNQDSFLIASCKPFKRVVGATIGRWIKDLLKDAVIDTDYFSAHSTRGASASRAVRIGVAIDSVLSTAQWANASTFARFYNRDIGVNFGNATRSWSKFLIVRQFGLHKIEIKRKDLVFLPPSHHVGLFVINWFFILISHWTVSASNARQME